MIDTRTIRALDALGYTHIEAACGNKRCGSVVQYPFRMLLARKGGR